MRPFAELADVGQAFRGDEPGLHSHEHIRRLMHGEDGHAMRRGIVESELLLRHAHRIGKRPPPGTITIGRVAAATMSRIAPKRPVSTRLPPSLTTVNPRVSAPFMS